MKTADFYSVMRNNAFSLPFKETIRSQTAPIGAVMELKQDSMIITVVAFRTGEASVYFSNGGAFLGGVGKPEVKDAATRFVETSGNFTELFKETEVFPYPDDDSVVFYLLAPGKVYAAEDLKERYAQCDTPLLPLLNCGMNVYNRCRELLQKN